MQRQSGVPEGFSHLRELRQRSPGRLLHQAGFAGGGRCQCEFQMVGRRRGYVDDVYVRMFDNGARFCSPVRRIVPGGESFRARRVPAHD